MTADTQESTVKSDLPTRFVLSIIMIALACVAIYVGGWLFRLLVLAGAAVMLIEWSDMHRASRPAAYLGAAFMAVTLLVVPELLFPAGEQDEFISAASFEPVLKGIPVALGFALLLAILTRRIAMGWGFLYVGLPALALLVIEWTWFALVFWVMLVVWATDIFAYFAGRSIGGPKLAPRISPNKTWAGLIGGMAGAEVVGALAAHWFQLGAPFLWIGAGMGLLAQLGDLYESWVKRRAGVKDSGTLLPGHGGALDRLDGLLPVALATFAILMAGLWTG
jgi:phosphatidate cytidylyltransferase